MKIPQSIVIYILLFFIALSVVIPFSHPGYFPTHDGEWAIVRLGDMFRSLRDHQFPVRYSGYLNFGYGYPLFNFEYPAPSYLGMVFHVLHFGFTDTLKLLFALSVFVSAFSMYFLASEIWHDKIAGVASAILYIYYPYRIVDLYARGSIGESLSFALFPLVLFFVVKLIDDEKPVHYLILGSIAYGLLILMHNIMAFLFTPVLVIFIAAKLASGRLGRFRLTMLFFLFGFGLSAFFWFPALLEKHFVLLSIVPIADRNIYFVHFSQLLIPRWGYGLPDHPDGFSYQIGLPHITVYLVTVFLTAAFWLRRKKSEIQFSDKLTTIIIGIIFIYLLLLFSFTAPVWRVTPLLKEINYPWTLLGPIGFLVSLLAGYLFTHTKIFRYFIVTMCILAIILVLPHAVPQSYFDKGDSFYLTNQGTTTSSQELTPLWVKQKPTHMANQKIGILKGRGTLSNVLYNSRLISFTLSLSTASVVRINTTYYPGWVLQRDGKDTSFSYNNIYGVMDIAVPPGQHTVVGTFGETPLRLLSDMISVISLCIMVFLIVYSVVRKGECRSSSNVFSSAL